MAIKRDIPPELWTNQEFVQCSPTARLLWIGLLTEADDNGVFRWRPAEIKMRLAPGDALDMEALLRQLVEGQLVLKYESGGRPYGAIRDFRVHQHPKRPKATYPVTEEVLKWVGLEGGVV